MTQAQTEAGPFTMTDSDFGWASDGPCAAFSIYGVVVLIPDLILAKIQ